ncbi:membrane protein [Alteromonas sp. KUL49]|nr:membrane protein [Alteromonas sp. KUL49]
MVPFFLSIFIAIACSPIINYTSKFGVPRWLSITFVILIIVVFGFLLAGLVGQSMTEFRENLPTYRTQLDKEFAWIVGKLSEYNININGDLIAAHLDPATAMSVATNFISGMGGVLSNLFLILLTVIFMLFEANSMPHRLHIALADPDMKMKHIDRFIRSVNSYLAIKTVVSLGTGTIIGIWLYVMGVDHFMLWAVLAFMLNYIPNIGSIIAAVPAVMIAFVQYGVASAGMAALGFLLVNTVMGNIVEPRLMGRGMGLSTLVVFLSLIFWGWLLGTVGMLLSVPLTMVVKIALESREESKWLAVLLSSDGKTTS